MFSLTTLSKISAKNGDVTSWLSFVALLQPNEDLFKCALSTYDISLASLVAGTLNMVFSNEIYFYRNRKKILWLGHYNPI